MIRPSKECRRERRVLRLVRLRMNLYIHRASEGVPPGVRAGRRELSFGLSVGGAFVGTANRRKPLRLCSSPSEAVGTPRTQSALTPAKAHVCAACRPGGPTSE